METLRFRLRNTIIEVHAEPHENERQIMEALKAVYGSGWLKCEYISSPFGTLVRPGFLHDWNVFRSFGGEPSAHVLEHMKTLYQEKFKAKREESNALDSHFYEPEPPRRRPVLRDYGGETDYAPIHSEDFDGLDKETRDLISLAIYTNQNDPLFEAA